MELPFKLSMSFYTLSMAARVEYHHNENDSFHNTYQRE